jgi:hypothetical protein
VVIQLPEPTGVKYQLIGLFYRQFLPGGVEIDIGCGVCDSKLGRGFIKL